ncbi:HNH endonuclease [Myroides odoratimimus]|uniref:HNH endonuclease n=1 Tax=Myroides odoratimimus TaxID=76832 RepID=UPI0025789218|nr:HNH endonuclease [Myroides odoratimimus]MDM1496668.1 HNH endonuclease [Myroides odoratimimus]
MKNLVNPTKNVSDVLNIIINEASKEKTKLDIESTRDNLQRDEINYAIKVLDNTLFEIEQNSVVSDRISNEEMIRYYEYRLLRKPQGRKIYDEVLLSAPHSECPYCTIRMVSTIDHFLPKSEYPNYSITPINLIPACKDCNTDKKTGYPKVKNDQLFHPYFDKVDNIAWIKAEIIPSEPLSFQFTVVNINNWSQTQNERATKHFDEFKINELFSNEANRELRSSQRTLKKHHAENKEILKAHLIDAYESSLEGVGVLYWKTLMYHEMSTNEWFLNGCQGNSFFQD